MRYSEILLTCFLMAFGHIRGNRDGALEVTYIANEGFLISMGGTKVLIDALFKSDHFVSPSDTLAATMMEGKPPFDSVDYALVTHDHADHFNPEMMSHFLISHPATEFVASSRTCEELPGESAADRRRSGIGLKMGEHRTIPGDKAEVTLLRLDHSGSREISNFAFLVRSNGFTIVHVGDALLAHNEEHLRAFDWSSYSVDLLFLEHFDRSSPALDIMKNIIRPKHLVLMHVPAGEEESVRAAWAKIVPRAVVFEKELETKRFAR